MKIQNVPFFTVEWDTITSIEYKGETGMSWCKTIEQGNIRVRMIEYGAGYKADHWCSRGHVVLVLKGELTVELENGKFFHLLSGMSFQVADTVDAHRAYTDNGALVFIVD